MEVRWLEGALADLEAIQDYLLDRDPSAALRVVAILRDAGNGLATFPHRGRPGRWDGTREFVVSGTSYLLPYRVRAGVVEILRVFHGARDWPQGS